MAYWRGPYLYRSRREGKRVVSEYLGCGESAACLAQLEAVEADRREGERMAKAQRRERERALDSRMNQAEGLLRQLTRAALLANGYHAHKGQWRRRRHDSAGD